VHCDPHSPDNHSRNFVNSFQNWWVFDAGFHTVHHEHAGTHWSEYRRLHRERGDRIDPRLNESSIFGFVFKRYVLGSVMPSLRAPIEWPAGEGSAIGGE
jgi:fatty acid desaturase